jgi:hypothetical protein
LALKALVEYDLRFSDAEGKVQVEMIINKDLKNKISLEFDSSTPKAVVFPLFQHLLIEGEKSNFEISVKSDKGKKISFPFYLGIDYRTEKPLVENKDSSPFIFRADFVNPLGNTFTEGNSYQLEIFLENKWDSSLGMTIINVGLPGNKFFFLFFF